MWRMTWSIFLFILLKIKKRILNENIYIYFFSVGRILYNADKEASELLLGSDLLFFSFQELYKKLKNIFIKILKIVIFNFFILSDDLYNKHIFFNFIINVITWLIRKNFFSTTSLLGVLLKQFVIFWTGIGRFKCWNLQVLKEANRWANVSANMACELGLI